jgi:hypothetical protein
VGFISKSLYIRTIAYPDDDDGTDDNDDDGYINDDREILFGFSTMAKGGGWMLDIESG